MTNSTAKLAQITNNFWYSLDKTDKEVLECVEFEGYSKTTHRLHDVIFVEINDYVSSTISYYIQDINA